jgi:hypothetical protein
LRKRDFKLFSVEYRYIYPISVKKILIAKARFGSLLGGFGGGSAAAPAPAPAAAPSAPAVSILPVSVLDPPSFQNISPRFQLILFIVY